MSDKRLDDIKCTGSIRTDYANTNFSTRFKLHLERWHSLGLNNTHGTASKAYRRGCTDFARGLRS